MLTRLRYAQPALIQVGLKRELRAPLLAPFLSSSSSSSSASLITLTHTSRPASYTTSSIQPRISYASHRTFASHSIVVPGMGDSISEGTLAEVLTPVGAGVQVDDVVAKLDTDKVSVDIRSTVAGSISKWHAKIGDTVKVGSNLLDVEVGAAGKSVPSSSIKPASPVQSTAAPPNADVGEKSRSPVAQSGTQPPTSSSPTDSPHRVPSIHFRHGKRDPTHSVPAHRTGHQHQGNQTVEVTGSDFLAANEAAAAAWDALPQRYKKKSLKEVQLTLIELGGADNYEKKKKSSASA